VSVEVDAIAFEGDARMVAGTALGAGLRAEGFLSAKSSRSRKIVLHVTRIEFVEGN
jgi:primosomal replication protein N